MKSRFSLREKNLHNYPPIEKILWGKYNHLYKTTAASLTGQKVNTITKITMSVEMIRNGIEYVGKVSFVFYGRNIFLVNKPASMMIYMYLYKRRYGSTYRGRFQEKK